MNERSAQRVEIKPSAGWARVDFGELWRYRTLMWRFCMRDIQARYKQTVFGVLWAIVQPVMMMVIMTVIFGKGLRLERTHIPDVPYAISFLAAHIVWHYFSGGLSSVASSVVGNSEIIRKVYFPRLIVPIAGLGTASVDFVIAFGVFLVALALKGFAPGTAALLLPLVILSILIGAFGIGVLVAAMMVSYRDFRYVVPYCLQIGFFLTPVIWWEEQVATMMGDWAILLYLNPAAGPVTAFRDIMLNQPLYWQGWLLSTMISTALAILGVAYFARVEKRFADVA